MATQAKHFVEKFLEKIPRESIERFRTVIMEMAKGQSGIYALYHNNELYYVGRASGLMGRLKRHMEDRHKDGWNYFSIYMIPRIDTVKELESLLLRVGKPAGNKIKGKLRGAQNLKDVWKNKIRENHRHEEHYFTGRSLTNNKSPKTKADSTVLKSLSIRSTYKGKTYKARIDRRGKIKLNNRVYETLTAAAVAIVKRSVNGWEFWKYRAANGKWLAVKTLK